jgi:hypothetical protein
MLKGVLIGGLASFVLLALFIRFLLPRLLTGAVSKFAVGLFEAKAAAMRNATCSLLDVTPLDGPPPDQEAEKPGQWFRLRCNVCQADNQSGAFQYWEPEELVAVRSDRKPKGLDDLDDCSLQTVITRLTRSDEDKIAGPIELQVDVCVPENCPAVNLCYYSIVLEPSLQLGERLVSA